MSAEIISHIMSSQVMWILKTSEGPSTGNFKPGFQMLETFFKKSLVMV